VVPVLAHEPPGLLAAFTVEDATSERVGRVLRLDVRPDQELEGPGHQLLVREVSQRIQVPELLLRRGRLLEALDVAVVLRLAAVRSHDSNHGRGDRRVDGCGVAQLLLEALGGLGLRVGVVAEHGEGPDEESPQLSGQVVLALGGLPPERLQPWPHQLPHERPEALPRLALDQAVAPPEAGDQRPPHGDVGLVRELGGQLAEGGSGHRAGDDCGPGVVEQRVPLDGRQLALRGRREPGAQRVVIGDAVEAVAPAVDHDHGVGREQRQPQLVLIEQHLRLLGRAQGGVGAGRPGHDLANADRDGPARVAEGRRVRSLLVEEEAVLTQDEGRAVRVERGGDEGIALLPDPAVHDAPDGLPGGGLERVPEIRRLGVPVAVLGQVVADAVAEPLLAEVLLQHAQQRAALLVGQDVEHPVGVRGRDDLELHGPGGREAVGLEGGRALQTEGLPPLPGRPEGVAGRHLHEGREGLVEPDPVPPAHGHEVAEPHVRELVRHHVGHDLLLGLRGRHGVDEEAALPERDAAQVLHGPGREVGQCDQVDLVRWVGDPVVVLEPAQGEAPDLEPEAGQRLLARHVDEAHGDAADVDRIGRHERADDEGDQVGRHGHGVGEADDVAAVRADVAGDLGPVRDGQQVVGDDHRHREDGFEIRLVPAGKGPPAVRGLHLAGGDDPLVPCIVLVGRAVPAVQLVVERAREGQRETGFRAGGHSRGQCERDPLVLLVDRPGDGGLDPVERDHRGGEVELGRVADELIRGLVDGERDVGGTGEAGAVEVRFEDEVVADRVDGARQPVGVARHATSVGQPPRAIRSSRTCCGCPAVSVTS
jgi:hypothetical protein